jgi:hypothetical protein
MWMPQQFANCAVDTPKGADYIRLNNEGGAPLAAGKFSSTKPLLTKSREPRKRHSDGPGAESETGHDFAFAKSVL